MSNKKKFDLLIVGSGLASAGVVSSYLKKNKEINIISPNKLNFKKEKKFNFLDSCPPQYYKNTSSIFDYHNYNQIEFDKELFIMGSLMHGGLSNNWGYQIDKDYKKDIQNLNKKNQKVINECFNELFKVKKNISFKQNKFADYLLKQKFKNHHIKQSNLAILDENQKKIKKTNTYSFFNLIKKNKIKEKIKIHNFFVDSIFKSKKNIGLNVIDKYGKRKILITKKLVLACGTIVTTSLILKYLNIKNKIKLLHHPRVVASFFSRLKLTIPEKITPFANIKDKGKKYIIDFRPYNKQFGKLIKHLYKKYFPFNYLLFYLIEFFKNRIFFSNIFFSSKMSNMYLQIKKDKIQITYKEKKYENYFKKTFYLFKNFLLKKKLILNIYKFYISEYGSDYHYFGTFDINNKKKKYLNENCQLLKNKNIYIVDGSCFNCKSTFFPAGLIISNARRIGKIL